MRPRGSYGEIAGALTAAAERSGPGTVRELAARSRVSYAAARYTASRLVGAGALVVISPGRPAVLDVPSDLDAGGFHIVCWPPSPADCAASEHEPAEGRVA